jgi:TRAP-type C4-dicarboxylate transport system permease small subunit
MWVNKVVKVFDVILAHPSTIFHKIGGWILAGLMILTAFDVLGRNLLNMPIVGTFDLTELMMSVMVTSGMAHVALTKSQIKADVLVVRLPLSTQKVLHVITEIASLIIVVLMMIYSFTNMIDTFGYQMKTGTLYINVYPFMGIVGFGFIMVTLVIIRNLFEVFQKQEVK